MALDCFIDLVGINICEGQEKPAGGYLNSLPGISLQSIDKIADSEQITFKGVWDDVQESALQQFRIDVLDEIKKCYQLNRDCDYDAMICENVDGLALAWRYMLGVWLMVYRLNSDRVNRFTTIDREQATELRDFYQLKYEQALKQGVNLMDTTSCCLDCGGNPEVVTYAP